MPKRSSPPDAAWQALLLEAHRAADDIPEEAKPELMEVIDGLTETAEHYQIPPRAMAAFICAMVGFLALVEVREDVDADEEIDAFIQYCHAAVHVAVAKARIDGGWTRDRPN